MPSKPPFILAIDTSCDDTSAAVTCGTIILANVVASQTQLHKQYGGVFPTVAKQAHKENIKPVVRAALRRAGIELKDLGAIAVTQGPGLAPALEVGIQYAKELATQLHLPLMPINHIEGHVLSVLAEPRQKKHSLAHQYQESQQEIQKQRFPVLSVIVSGGHTEFILVKKIGEYERLGFTVDDAAGEALDKFGRMVDLGYPAGPVIEQFALKGDSHKYIFPLPMTTSGNANMSFSGLKTSARNLTEQLRTQKTLTKQDIYDLCASFQYSIFRAITYKLSKVLSEMETFGLWLGGGVASNVALRAAIRKMIKDNKFTVNRGENDGLTVEQAASLTLSVPYSKRLCSDNAAMIGVAAGFHLERGETTESAESVERAPRWEVDQKII